MNRPLLARSMVFMGVFLSCCQAWGSMPAPKGKIAPLLQTVLTSYRAGKDLSEFPGCFRRNGKAFIKLFMEFTEIEDEFSELGVEVRERSGTLATAIVPLESVSEVARFSQVLRMGAGCPVVPALDCSVPYSRVDEVWSDPDWGVDQGEGVLLGMVDWGISLLHEDFRDEQGTRIQYLWDFSLGLECDAASIDQQTCGQEDSEGHGTGVMGVMAGNGRADCGQDEPCSGVAPGAGILAVKLGPNPTSVDVAEAVALLFAKADEMGMPVVLNLGLSWFCGPRDGSSEAERFISGLLGEGRIVAAAAGNQGVTRGHAEGNLSDRKMAEAIFRLGAPAPRSGSLEGWYDWGAHDQGDRIEMRVSCKVGSVTTPVTDWMEFGEGPQDFESAFGSVRADHNGETEKARGFSVRIVQTSDDLMAWRIEFQGTAADRVIDLWIDPLSLPTPAAGENPLLRFNELEHFSLISNRFEVFRKTVTPPCTADNVLCASSFNTRTSAGSCIANLGPGFLEDGSAFSDFSGRGPRRDKAENPELGEKPEVGAPGAGLIVPWIPGSSDYVTDYADGTSFASAHLAGTVALMLHLDPLLTPGEIRAALSVGGAVRPWPSSPSWNDDHLGYRGPGRLDALALVEAFFSLPEPPGNLVAEIVPTKRVGLSWAPSPSAGVSFYRIYWNSGSGSIDYGVPVAEVDGATTTYTTAKLGAGRTYAFGVRAVNDSGEEKNTTAQVSIRIPAPVPPGNLRTEVVNFRQVQLVWDASPSADVAFYHVYWDGGGGQINDAEPLATRPAGITSWLSGELGAGSYLFKVAAADQDLEADLANAPTVSATIFATLGSGDDDFCFIASAAFAHPDAPAVNRLREFRDTVLMKTAGGRRFVKAYYRLSPPVAAWLLEHPRIATVVRLTLTPVVGWAEIVCHRGLGARTGALLFLSAGFVLSGGFWMARRWRAAPWEVRLRRPLL